MTFAGPILMLTEDNLEMQTEMFVLLHSGAIKGLTVTGQPQSFNQQVRNVTSIKPTSCHLKKTQLTEKKGTIFLYFSKALM